MKIKTPIVVSSVIVVLMIAVLALTSKNNDKNIPPSGTADPINNGQRVKMPSFFLPSVLDGNMIASKNFEGKAMLIVFSATWSPPCMEMIPTLIQLQNEYGAQGFSVVELSVDEGGPEVVANVVKKEKNNYPVLMATVSTAKNFGGIDTLPTLFLINENGYILKKYPGVAPYILLARDIKIALKGAPDK